MEATKETEDRNQNKTDYQNINKNAMREMVTRPPPEESLRSMLSLSLPSSQGYPGRSFRSDEDERSGSGFDAFSDVINKLSELCGDYRLPPRMLRRLDCCAYRVEVVREVLWKRLLLPPEMAYQELVKKGKLLETGVIDIVRYVKSFNTMENFSLSSDYEVSSVENIASDSSINELLKEYNLIKEQNSDLEYQLKHLDWSADIFKISTLTSGRPLTCVTYHILEDRNLFKTIGLGKDVMMKFLVTLEDNYHTELSYHNKIHAADVVVSVNNLFSMPSLTDKFTSFEMFSTIIACAGHDVDHNGFTNNFMLKSHHKLANLYNMDSIRENDHYGTVCKIIKTSGCDITENMDSKRRRAFFYLLNQMILATDLTKHDQHINTLINLKPATYRDPLVLPLKLDKKCAFLNAVVHACDISNPSKPWHLYENWMNRSATEFFRMGAIEAELGLEISPMCDPKNTNFLACLTGFIDFIVKPIWDEFSEIVYPDASHIVINIDTNRETMEKKVAEMALAMRRDSHVVS